MSTKAFNPDWKRTYWPEPRFGKKRTRGSVVRELGAKKRVAREERKAERITEALNAD